MTDSRSLKSFFFLRAGVAFGWVAVAALVGARAPWLGPVLLALYIAWDALANVLDAQRTKADDAGADVRGQMTNAAVSGVAAIAALGGLIGGVSIAVIAFGVWALVAGVLQLLVAVRRRHEVGRGQWFLIVSGGQSAIAGIAFTAKGIAGGTGLLDLVPYAAFGGVYFLLSGVSLAFRRARG